MNTPRIVFGLLLMLWSMVTLVQADRLEDLTHKVTKLPDATSAQKLKKAALNLALEQAKNGFAAHTDDYANNLLDDISVALPKDLGSAGADPDHFPLLQPLLQPDNNPYLDALNSWTDQLLAQPDIAWKKSTSDFNPFTGLTKNYGTRDESIKVMNLIWLTAHSQSRYQANIELFTRLMRRADAYVDAYNLHAEKYEDDLNDFTALGTMLMDLTAVDKLWPDLIMPSERTQWNKMFHKASAFWLDFLREKPDQLHPHGPVPESRFVGGEYSPQLWPLSEGQALPGGGPKAR